jgi:hypothetical protein
VGHAAALGLVLALAQGAAPTKPPAAPLAPPQARAAVAGLAGFESLSTLDYLAQPGRPHELRTTYVFPDRARWWIAATDGRMEERRLRYRYGGQVLAVEPRSATSVEYRAEDRTALLGAFELRRALFLWPDGFAWSGDGAVRTATLGEVGTLRARLGPGERPRPVEIELLEPDGALRDACRQVTWREGKDRAWPATLELWSGTTLVWKETVRSIDVETRWIDSFFVPPDRRGVTGVAVGAPRGIDIPPTCLRRCPLPAGADWYAARAERQRLLEDAAARALPALENWATFEVGPDGAPTAVLLRLDDPRQKPPEGYASLPERLGVAASVKGLDGVGTAPLDGLRKLLPQGARPGAAYVRFDPRAAEPDVVVVLPYE